MYNYFIKFVVIALVLGLNMPGVLAMKEALAYFGGIENFNSTTLQAGTLDFAWTSPDDFFPNVTPTQSSSRQITLTNQGSLDFQYNAYVVETGGNHAVCDALKLEAKLNGNIKYPYSGSSDTLLGFNLVSPIEFSDPSDVWNFTVILASSDAGLQGEVCDFDFVFNGSQIGGIGFSNQKIIPNRIVVGHWGPTVVLNEFLPNAGNYPEFIEIYNTTDSPINLHGYKIRTDNKVIPINPATTGRFSNGNTTIPAYGWLVVAAPVAAHGPPHGWADIMDDSAGFITFYNKNNVEIDSYSYAAPKYNVNNNPGRTNNLVGYWPFDGSIPNGGNVPDLSGNGNNGVNNGTVSVTGKINEALDFGGVGDLNYVTIGTNSTLDTDELTFEAWIYPTELPTGTYIYEGRSTIAWNGDTASGKDPYIFYINEFGKLEAHVDFDNGVGEFVYGSAVLGLNQWHHAVLNVSSTKIQLYLNGSKDGSEVSHGHGAVVQNHSYLVFGRHMWYNNPFGGLIDEVKIYDRALDAGEVLEHYNDVSTLPSNAVPVDKSFARIPDGVGDWVDPVPTIGGPNRLSLGEVNATIAAESVIEGVVEKEIVEDNEIPDPLVANNDIFNVLSDIGGEIIDAVTGGSGDADTHTGDEVDVEAPADETDDEADDDEISDTLIINDNTFVATGSPDTESAVDEIEDGDTGAGDDEVLDMLIINNNTFVATGTTDTESVVDEIEDGDCANADTGDGEEAVTNAPVEPVEPIEQSEVELPTNNNDDEVDTGDDEVLDMLIINNNTFVATGTTDTENTVDEIGDGNNDNAEEVPADETAVVVEPEPVELTSRDSE